MASLELDLAAMKKKSHREMEPEFEPSKALDFALAFTVSHPEWRKSWTRRSRIDEPEIEDEEAPFVWVARYLARLPLSRLQSRVD